MPYGGNYDAGVQPYKYTGKEFDTMNGLNLIDSHARQQDPVVPSFDSVDPLAEDYYSWSPYVYCLNNPLKYIDPDGRDVINADNEKVEEAKRNQFQKLQTLRNAIDMSNGTEAQQKARNKAFNKALNEVNKVNKDLAKAEKVAAQTQARIDNFKNVDPEYFNVMDNLTYTDNNGNVRNLDVYVSSGTLSSGIDKGETNFAPTSTGRVFSQNGENTISVTLKIGSSTSSNILAHEFGHVSAAADDPVGYYRAVKSVGSSHDCQDAKNVNHPVSQRAIHWQNRYNRLKKALP